MTFTILALLIISAVLGFLAKIATKRRMGRALGREVKDHELNSINSWMKVREAEEHKD
jgi:hypothetical protein